MKWIKKLGLAPFVFALIVVLVIARVSNPDLFKSNANLALSGILNPKTTITAEELNLLPDSYILVNLNKVKTGISVNTENTVSIPFENLLHKQNQKILKEADKPIILYADDIAVSTKAWVILNQLKFKNIFIVEPGENSEVLKYRFQPDTTIRPEPVSN